MPSIAATTGTRIESACKHQVACKIDFEHMLSWVGYDQIKLEREHVKWSMDQDDLVVGIAQPMRDNEPNRTNARNKAYPSVVVTTAEMEPAAMNYLICLYHNARTMRERDQFIRDVEMTIDQWVSRGANVAHAKKQIQEMPEFYSVGVAVGHAYAHPNSGDNVATVMIGGLKTVLNGAFEVHAGDLIQWYWDEERPCFKANGYRHDQLIQGQFANATITSDDVDRFIAQNKDMNAENEHRRRFYDRGNGNIGPVRTGKVRVAYPKPFHHDDENERIYDRRRVFARALCSARPYEHVDIMICRQSL